MSEATELDTCGACEGVRPLTPMDVSNRPGLPALSWRAGTQARFKQTMLAELSSTVGLPRLATRDNNDPTIALIDAWATTLDVLTFYQERIANENYLGTATELRSVLELARAIGYELAPGVAASAFLAFNLEEAPGAPLKARIPQGTKVQSVPGQDEKPQTFETAADIDARRAWNEMPARFRGSKIPFHGQSVIHLAGVSTGLMPGEGLLIVGDERVEKSENDNWDFRRVKRVDLVTNRTDPTKSYTVVTMDRPLGSNYPYANPARKNARVFVLRQRAALFGHNAPDWRVLPNEIRARFVKRSEKPDDFEDWPRFNLGYADAKPQDPKSFRTLYLEAAYPAAVRGAWMVVSADKVNPSGSDYDELYRITDAEQSGQRQFALTGKSTKVVLSGENLVEKYWDRLREIAVYLATDELTLVEGPLTADIVAGTDRLELESALLGDDVLPKGRVVMLAGNDPATGEPQAEVLVLEEASSNQSIDGRQVTVLNFVSNLTHSYARASLRVRGNVVAGSHGETKKETLGSGNGSAVFQKFTLKQQPLTYVSSATEPSGRSSSLEVRVGGVRWDEVPSFYGRGSDERIFVTRRTDAGVVTVQFGDGRTGARLPTGVENVIATYRVGMGFEGLVAPGQLSLLSSRPFGVKEVTNPQASEGAQDPERLADARAHAPRTVLTLDRVVSLDDYEDFARAYAGIGKAAAILLRTGEQPTVHLTIALADGTSPAVDSSTKGNLVSALDLARHALVPVIVQGFAACPFEVTANVAVDPAYEADAVIANALTALRDRFAFEQREFGQLVTEADVIATLQKVTGVVYVDLEALAFKGQAPTRTDWLPARRARVDATGTHPADLLTLAAADIHLNPIVP